MSSPTAEYDENQQTLQFYKIKLMEKQRQISDHTAKLKKIQFKNNRDLKQLKIAEEKAKQQLKQQKAKFDNIYKKMTQVTEQNAALQYRLNQLKEQKDKQIQSTRAQYNHLKTQVRSYERILPTHTFMSKLGANYSQLPTYEQIFMNWKDKSQKYEEMQQKLKKYKAQTQQKLQMQQKVNQSLQKKKIQLEKQLRDDLTKLLDNQVQLTTATMQRDEFRQILNLRLEQLNNSNQANEELTELNKKLQQKIQQVVRIYHEQMQKKQEQFQKISQEQFRKYQDQLQRITKIYEGKQNSHLQQLAYFQQQEHRLLEKIQKDKEKFQQNYREMYTEVEQIKRQLDIEKQEHFRQRSEYQKIKQQLKHKQYDCLDYLRKLGQNQMKIEQLNNQIKRLQQKILASKDESTSKYSSIIQQKINLEQKIKQLLIELQQAREQNNHKDNQIRILNSQIDELKSKGSHKSTSFTFPGDQGDSNIQSIRVRSNTEENSQFERVSLLNEINNPTHLSVPNNQMRKRQDSLISQQSRRKTSSNFYTQQQLEAKLAQNQSQLQKRYEKKIQQMKQRIENQLNQNFAQQLKNLNNEHRKQNIQSKKRQQQLQNKLKKIYQQNQVQKIELNQTINKWNKKYDLLKMEKDTLQQNYIEQINQSKRDKQGLNVFKNQNRQLQKTLKENQRIIQNLNSQLQALKKFKQKVEMKQSKQKSISSESSSINYKEIIQKYTSQITKLMEQKQQSIKIYNQLQNEANDLRKTIEQNKKQRQQMQVQLNEKIKQNDMLQDLLDHERKDRSLRTVPSLASLTDQQTKQQENFKQFYNQAGQKEGQIILLQRDVEDLKIQIQQIKQKHELKIASLDEQIKQYIQTIVGMKMKVAESMMKADQKTYLYNQLKKKFNVV